MSDTTVVDPMAPQRTAREAWLRALMLQHIAQTTGAPESVVAEIRRYVEAAEGEEEKAVVDFMGAYPDEAEREKHREGWGKPASPVSAALSGIQSYLTRFQHVPAALTLTLEPYPHPMFHGKAETFQAPMPEISLVEVKNHV